MASRTRPRFARLAALGAIAALGVALSGCSVINELTGGVERDEDGQVVTGNENADVFSIKIGDCIDSDALSGEIDSVPIVPCSEEHDAEAFANVLLEDGDYPSQDVIDQAAEEACYTDNFEEFVGVAYDDSELDATYLSPTQESWTSGSDREILCLITDPAGKSTGSLEGADR
ncbi:septum formation family protein [Homoserinibacter sp. YIM 151385]|uniref:septum formation family protein n=1 Tax=Homoserinibacter sp. YIM 151385 TaxID=2985506 RepID=UPI0022F0E5F8|nr:septum formation family protein [Homoserinibacter sp. YIM 151385]WBU38220.1 septum formation family protein [Homoserinibacter sp. YIM 151385]